MSKSSALPTVHWIAVINGRLDRHRCLLGTHVKKLKLLYKVLKINFVMPEDIAMTSSKSDVNPCSHGRETVRQKIRTDRQTDGFSALYSRLLNPVLLNKSGLVRAKASNFNLKSLNKCFSKHYQVQTWLVFTETVTYKNIQTYY